MRKKIKVIEVKSVKSCVLDGTYKPMRRIYTIDEGITAPVFYTKGVDKAFGVSVAENGHGACMRAVMLIRRLRSVIQTAIINGDNLVGPMEFRARRVGGDFIKVWAAVVPFSMTDNRIALTIFLPEEY